MSTTLTPAAAKWWARYHCRKQLDLLVFWAQETEPDPTLLELAASDIQRRAKDAEADTRPVILLTKALAEVVRCDDLLCPAFRAVLVDTLTTRARELRELLEEGR